MLDLSDIYVVDALTNLTDTLVTVLLASKVITAKTTPMIVIQIRASMVPRVKTRPMLLLATADQDTPACCAIST